MLLMFLTTLAIKIEFVALLCAPQPPNKKLLNLATLKRWTDLK